ncbi:hypothetical protein LTS10_000107 [Elasticomyces elasticus]|nr:hypothetical protein LTS10_000107 [Elasticomyces elasticus]
MTAKKRSKDPALWPLVRLVSIAIRGSRILLYYTIYDLPGPDTNQVRANTTLRCIETCDMAWVVGKGDRICENKAVSGFLERYGERFENTVSQLGEQGCRVPSRYKELTRKAAPLGAEIYKRDKRIVRIQDLDNPVRLSLQSEKDALQRPLDVLNHERFELLVNARNRWLERNLQDDTRGILPTGMELSVHSISNRHYAAAQGIFPIPPPRLTPEMTGVPAFRAHALSEAAPAASQTLYKYIQSQYGVFLQGLDLWANSEYIPDSDALRQGLDRPREKFAAEIEGILELIGNEAREKITEPLAQGRSQWGLQAEKEVKKLNKWHWCTIRSFVNNYGAHETELVAFQNWNENFMEPAIKAIIKPKWHSLQVITTAHFTQVVTLEGAGSPFNILGERIAQDVSKYARKCALSLMQDFDASIKTIRAAFEFMLAERELTTTERPFRENLRAYLDREQFHVEDIKSRVAELLGGTEYQP